VNNTVADRQCRRSGTVDNIGGNRRTRRLTNEVTTDNLNTGIGGRRLQGNMRPNTGVQRNARVTAAAFQGALWVG
jgi:hypothetical protein